MINENEQIINIISSCFEEERDLIEYLYKKTQKNGDLINHVLRAGFLLRTVANQEMALERREIQVDHIPLEFLRSTIQLALLVSAIETIGAPVKYRSFNEWLNKEFFVDKGKKYSFKEINRAWQKYNEIYGSSKSFRDVILNSGMDELLSEFFIIQPIRLYDFSKPSEEYEDKIQVKDLKHPEKVAEFAITLYRDKKPFFLYKKEDFYELLQVENFNADRVKIYNITDLNEYQIKLDELETLSEVVILKNKSLRKFLRPNLNYIYHLRSGYYHTGKIPVSDKTDFMFHGPWKDSDGREYSPLVTKRLVPLFWKLARKVIIEAWKQKVAAIDAS